MKLKKKLKQIHFIFEANARFKASKCHWRYKRIRTEYERAAVQRDITWSEEQVSHLLQRQLCQRGVQPTPLRSGELRFFYVGTNRNQDYSGIIQGLECFGEVIPFEGQPGIYGQIWPSSESDLTTREVNARRLVEQVEAALKCGPIHAVIGQMWAFSIHPDALQRLRDMGLIVVNISMDDRHAFFGKRYKGVWLGTAGLIPVIDLAATAAPECPLWYLVEGCPAIYLPEASDPNLFRPMPGPKLYDVCFVGANYGIRSKIVRAIEKGGVRVECYGSAWPNGLIPTENMPQLFAHSRIVLGVGTIGYCTDFYALKMRDFDGPMSGSLYLTHRNPDLEYFFVIGKEIECYRNADECVEKVHYYLNHPDEAEAIGRAGRARAEREHTWEKRFEKLLRTIGLLI